MLHVTREGYTLKPGFNFYPLWDRASAGFRLLVGRALFRMRYSKIRQRWFVGCSMIQVL